MRYICQYAHDPSLSNAVITNQTSMKIQWAPIKLRSGRKILPLDKGRCSQDRLTSKARFQDLARCESMNPTLHACFCAPIMTKLKSSILRLLKLQVYFIGELSPAYTPVFRQRNDTKGEALRIVSSRNVTWESYSVSKRATSFEQSCGTLVQKTQNMQNWYDYLDPLPYEEPSLTWN